MKGYPKANLYSFLLLFETRSVNKCKTLKIKEHTQKYKQVHGLAILHQKCVEYLDKQTELLIN